VLWRATEEGWRDRFKLRVRHYGGAGSPSYLEHKHRFHRVVRKERLPYRPEHLGRLDNKGLYSDAERPALDRFRTHVHQIGARPACWVYYQREAYTVDEGFGRVSIDSDLHCEWAHGHGTPQYHGARWQPVALPGDIVEFKFRGPCPRMFARMIQRFELRRISLSKYAVCVRALRGAPEPIPFHGYAA